jgi:primosomal replication protein N
MNHPSRRSVKLLLALFVGYCLHVCMASSPASKGLILRIRLADGTMEKVAVPSGSEETMTVDDVLKPFEIEEGASIQVGLTTVEDATTPISKFGVKNGSMITVKSTVSQKPTESRFAKLKVQNHSWDPFHDLAKDYEHAVLKVKTRRSSNKGGSYGDIAQLALSLHVLEPQQEGRLKRVYMCRNSAERFHANGLLKKSGGIVSRTGLLLGTIQRERVETGPRKARTSLSSQTSDSDYCTVAKVHALWEPPGQKASDATSNYDASLAESLLDKTRRVLDIAEYLGLVPVGWIFSYQDNRNEDEDALPVFGLDVQTGAKLQIANMRSKGIVDGAKFATLAMDANIGATEAFQLSDVSVQMVHESILVIKDGESTRHVATKNPVMVDGKQANDIDSVLCLVNTAMLSHVGSFAGKTAASSIKKNGSLTKKAKTAILSALEDDSKLLEELCDLNVLVALDQSLSDEDTAELCQVVRKWSRGLKQGTQVASKLKMRLKGVLET